MSGCISFLAVADCVCYRIMLRNDWLDERLVSENPTNDCQFQLTNCYHVTVEGFVLYRILNIRSEGCE